MMRFGNIKPDIFADYAAHRMKSIATGGANGDPVRTLHGVNRKLGVINIHRNGKQLFRRYVKPEQPNSLDQQIHSRWFSKAEKHWLTIYDTYAESWALYAEQHQSILRYEDMRMNNGRHLLREIQLTRQQLGMEMSNAPPVKPPVRSKLEVFQNAVQEDNAFSFQVMHNIPNPAGMRLLVEITPATVRPTRKPHPRSYRPIRGKNAGSYVELQESGATYTVTGARYNIAHGERYGIRLRIIDTELISGDSITADFIHEVHNPPELSVGTAVQEPMPQAHTPAARHRHFDVIPAKHENSVRKEMPVEPG
jgi:hypothetical protein